MKRKILVISLNLLVIAWLIILQSTKVSATLGNIESLVYSDDEFDGDKNFATSLKSTFTTGGLKASLWTRPTSEYGINSILSNSDCTYISKGYRAAIGYKGKVGVGECREFEKDFLYNWVVEKKCIINAFTAARDYVSSKYGSSNPVPATAAFFGNGSLKH